MNNAPWIEHEQQPAAGGGVVVAHAVRGGGGLPARRSVVLRAMQHMLVTGCTQ